MREALKNVPRLQANFPDLLLSRLLFQYAVAHAEFVSIDGFSNKRCDRNRNGGVVPIYIKDSLFDKCSVREDVHVSSLEAVCVECKPVRSASYICFAYY